MNNDILIFKTSVETADNVNSLRPMLDSIAGRGRWNFALDDCDRILRVVSGDLQPDYIIGELARKGFQCRELEY